MLYSWNENFSVSGKVIIDFAIASIRRLRGRWEFWWKTESFGWKKLFWSVWQKCWRGFYLRKIKILDILFWGVKWIFAIFWRKKVCDITRKIRRKYWESSKQLKIVEKKDKKQKNWSLLFAKLCQKLWFLNKYSKKIASRKNILVGEEWKETFQSFILK